MFYLNQQFLVGFVFFRFYWEKAVHWLVWLLNFFNQLRTWLKWVKTMVIVRWPLSRHRFSSVVFFAKNYALKTLSPKRLKSLQQKSKEVSENYCTQSQPPFNLKRFGNYSVGELQISQNGQNKLWLKRLVNRTRPLCQTSNRYISTILFNYFFDTFCTKF